MMWRVRAVAMTLSALIAAPATVACQSPRLWRGPVMDAVIHDLCNKRVVFLGEPPAHGFGRTLELKVMLAQRLIDECDFNAFLVEGGTYDFLNIRSIQGAGLSVPDSLVAGAIGGIWATAEVQPLIPFLAERARHGTLVLGGLDDQIGRGTYAQRRMAADLMARVPNQERARCLPAWQGHTLWQYTTDAPYGRNDRGALVTCLRDASTHTTDDASLAMLHSLERMLARDFSDSIRAGADQAVWMENERDRSMFINFHGWMSHLPGRSKVIVWTATTHAAKAVSGVPGREHIVQLGEYVHRELGESAFVLGFTALGGSYGMLRQTPRLLPPAPGSSLEARAFAGSEEDTAYLDGRSIRDLGVLPARPLGSEFKTARWSDVVDGLVVVRTERPPAAPP